PGAVGVERSGEQGRAGPLAEQAGQRRGRCKPPKERRPKAVIASMLVAQDSDHAAAAQEPNRFLKTFAPIEELHAKTGALLPNESIEMPVAEFLINRAQAGAAEIVRHDLRKQFPVAEVTERDHDRPAGAQLPMHLLRAVGLDQP